MNYKDYLGCLISGSMSTFIFLPIDAMRTRWTFGAQLHGIRSLYHGLGFCWATSILKQAAVFPTQTAIKHHLSHNNVPHSDILSGMAAGAVLALVSTPINVIRTPLLLDHKLSTRTIVKQIWHERGVAGFGRGGFATLLRDGVWNGMYFPTFQSLTEKTNNRLLSSMLAAGLAVTCSYAFDGIRIYRQNNKTDYAFWTGFKRAFNTSSGNAKAFTACLLRVSISTGISHVMYLKTNEALEELE